MNQLTTFAGRVHELQQLFHCLARAQQRQPQIVLVEGSSGSGKTKLLREFARRLAERGPEIAVVSVSAPAEAAYDPVLLAAREATHSQLYEHIGGRRKALESARELLPDWLGAIPVIGHLISAIVATAQSLQRRRQQDSDCPVSGDDDTDALIAASTRRTLVLLLDELEKGDRAAAIRVEALVRAAAGRAQLLVVGAARSTAPGTRPPAFGEMIAALPAPMVCKLALHELTAPELAAWIKKRFPHVGIPDSFLEWLATRTGGHPAAVEEILERLVSRSTIRFVNRRWEIGEAPADMEVSAGAARAVDLGSIGHATVELLEIASAIGVEFDSLTLARLIGKDELYVEDRLSLALRHGLIESRGETGVENDIATLYRFRSTHLRAALYRALSAELRTQLSHQQAFQTGPA